VNATRIENRILVLLLTGVFWTASAGIFAPPRAQEPKPEPKQGQDKKPPRTEDTISIDTTEVLLPVTVRDSSGAFVPNLKAEDFSVFEEGIPQPISSFAFKRMPVHVVLLLDTSSSVTKELDDFKIAAMKFVEQLDPEDKVCLIRFDDVVELVQDWTGSRATFRRALNRIQTGMFTKFHDALYLAAHEQLGKVKGRKAVIVLTDGIDSARGSITRDRAFRSMIEEEVPLYAVSKTRIQGRRDRENLDFYLNNSKSAANQLRIDGLKLGLEQLEESERFLTKLAEETGGRVYLPESFENLNEAYQQVADELRSQYVIFYTPTDSTRDGGYRAVRVKLKQPGLHVTTRFGYYSK
jgi:Ca-activated chloride channel homolog